MNIKIDKPVKLLPNNLLDSGIKFASAGVGYCVVATMYKLAISLQYSYGEITYHQKATRQKCFNTFCVFMTLIILPQVTILYTTDWIIWKYSEIANGLIFLFLTIAHTFVICKLFRNLKNVSNDDESTFHSERKKIVRQYLIFMAADTVRVIESFLTYYFITDNNTEIWLVYVSWIFRSPCDIFPVTYILYVHNRIYRRIA